MEVNAYSVCSYFEPYLRKLKPRLRGISLPSPTNTVTYSASAGVVSVFVKNIAEIDEVGK